jgi:DNA-binding CsgD family transcriptional regulator/tetratricopeptide (TPR) repeat protein
MTLLERDDALTTLRQAYADAGSACGRVVAVGGEPGIGKSALVEAFLAEVGTEARVLAGVCDDLSIPRPLGPFRDLIGSVSNQLRDAIDRDAPAHEITRLLIKELSPPPRPAVLVLEDVHWADDATLDVITMLARRIASLPLLLVITSRSGERPPGHAFESAIGALAAAEAWFIELTPLSKPAVAQLAGHRADEIYATTRGNPFFVTELVQCELDTQVTRTISHAVLGRAASLSEEGRALVELVSVVPGRASTAILDAAVPNWLEIAEEPERRHLLEIRAKDVRFRHELARHAIRSSLPTAMRRRLHARVLDALLAIGGDPADVVHHAEASGKDEVVAAHVLEAARRAAAAGSHREAFAHFQRALDFLDELLPAERTWTLEGLARTAYYVGRLDDGFAAVRLAIELHRAAGDEAGVGRCTRMLSRLHWYWGDGIASRVAAAEAVEILEPLGDSAELARAYSGVAQLAMLNDDPEGTALWGKRALELAVRVGDDGTRAHALVNLATVNAMLDPDDVTPLLDAHAAADGAGNSHEGTRALGNLGYAQMMWVRPVEALEYTKQALAYADEHEVDTLAVYNANVVAWLNLRSGNWEAAEAVARRQSTVGAPGFIANVVLATLAARRGEPDAKARVEGVTTAATRAAEIYPVVAAIELASEHALLTGTLPPVEWIEGLRAHVPPGAAGMIISSWAAVAGLTVADPVPGSPVYWAMQHGDWRGAADAFGEIGWTYDRALMLSLLDDEDALAEGIEIARALGAEPLVARIARRMRDLGLRVPRGPRQATRENPANLTARQLEVLRLLCDGRTNAEIADELVVSLRTAEHHVAAVLTKLGARDRRDATRRAASLGLLVTR